MHTRTHECGPQGEVNLSPARWRILGWIYVYYLRARVTLLCLIGERRVCYHERIKVRPGGESKVMQAPASFITRPKWMSTANARAHKLSIIAPSSVPACLLCARYSPTLLAARIFNALWRLDFFDSACATLSVIWICVAILPWHVCLAMNEARKFSKGDSP
jgi:hypothetical protein